MKNKKKFHQLPYHVQDAIQAKWFEQMNARDKQKRAALKKECEGLPELSDDDQRLVAYKSQHFRDPLVMACQTWQELVELEGAYAFKILP